MIYGNATVRRNLVIHLDYGEDVFESLQAIIAREEIHSGVIVSGYGTLNRCRYHSITTVGLPPKDGIVTLEGPFELMSIDGVIAGGKLHAHFMAGDIDRTFGGHLEPGNRVLYLCDVVIAEFAEGNLTFETSPHGLRLLAVQNGHKEPGLAVELDGEGRSRVTGPASGWGTDGK